MNRLYAGIDPGKYGCLCTIADNTDTEVLYVKTVRWEDTGGCMSYYNHLNDEAIALGLQTDYIQVKVAVEKLGHLPKNRETGQFKSSRKTFGQLMMRYGKILGALEVAGVNYTEVTTGSWQGFFDLKRKWTSNTEKKNVHKQLAQDLLPGIKVTHKEADAILIAYYHYYTSN